MEKRKSIFRQESLDRVMSPEQLDQYIRVSKPSAWILAAALFILGLSVLIWSVVGSLPQTVLVKGFVDESNTIYCYVDPSEVQDNWEGYQAKLTFPDNSTINGVVSEMDPVPYSINEISNIIKKDWIVDSIIDTNYVYQFKVETDKPVQPNVLVNASVTTNEVKPIEYILN